MRGSACDNGTPSRLAASLAFLSVPSPDAPPGELQEPLEGDRVVGVQEPFQVRHGVPDRRPFVEGQRPPQDVRDPEHAERVLDRPGLRVHPVEDRDLRGRQPGPDLPGDRHRDLPPLEPPGRGRPPSSAAHLPPATGRSPFPGAAGSWRSAHRPRRGSRRGSGNSSRGGSPARPGTAARRSASARRRRPATRRSTGPRRRPRRTSRPRGRSAR